MKGETREHKNLNNTFTICGILMFCSRMASGNLHIIVQRYWLPSLVFGKRPSDMRELLLSNRNRF